MPEEINRIVSDHLSTFLFAPTSTAVKNLETEGVPRERIFLTGDVMYDAAIHYGQEADQKSDILKRLGLEPKGYILATLHRAENTDDPSRLKAVVDAFVATTRDLPVVLPLHPRTRASLVENGLLSLLEGALCMLEPAGYLDMISLEKSARLIATDSGGVQKEAYFYRVPCVTLRDETEWVELVQAGWNRCVSPSLGQEAIQKALREWTTLFQPPTDTETFYGSGNAARIIVETLTSPGTLI
jgi:UDP-GlcNAc3NAcA epimerase